MVPSMPSSKKRCWTLLVKDMKNNAEEGDVLSSFRKKYTSIRKMTFRPQADYAADPPPNPATTTAPGGSMCIELQFTGPQPVEGPAGLICRLLQATFVAARPVQLDRGRKRKVRPGCPRPAPSYSFTLTPSAETTDGATLGSAAKAMGGDTTSPASIRCPLFGQESSISSSSLSLGYNTHSSNGGSTAAETKKRTTEDNSDTASVTSSATSSFSDVFDDFFEQDFASFHNGLRGGRLNLETVSSPAHATAASTAELPEILQLERSCSVMTVAGDDLPKWEDVIRRVDSPLSSSNPSGATNQPPAPLERFGEELAAAAAAAPTHADFHPASNSGVATVGCFDECGGNMMSQEEAVSLFSDAATATTPAATTAGAAPAGAVATANGGVTTSEDALWSGAPDEADALFYRGTLGRLCSSSWELDLVHAGSAVVANDNGDEDALDQRVSIVPDLHQAAALAGKQQPQQQPDQWYCDKRHYAAVVWATSSPAEDEISFAWYKQECDFDGRSTTVRPEAAQVPSPASASSSAEVEAAPLVPANGQCQFAFLGLQRAGYELSNLVARAQFYINSTAKVEKVASPTRGNEVASGTGGQVNVTVPFPSIREIWPEVYDAVNIRVLEVDMAVEVLSRDQKLVFAGPTLKVTYRRPAAETYLPTAVPMARQISQISQISWSKDANNFGPLEACT